MRQNSSLRRLPDLLLRALKSRRVLIVLSALVVGILVMEIPSLSAVQGEVLTLVITVALVLIGGYNVQDAVRAAREQNHVSTEELREVVKELIRDLIEEMDEAQDDEAAQAPQEQVNV